ncbi:MAG: CopG family antitoxin [Gallionellaceae bacterium]|nr:CopG family antitoxin [Gallionellaceae bacterium]
MSKHPKPIPRFETEDEERAFWETHDSADYVDWSKATAVSNAQDVPDQSLNQVWLQGKEKQH